MQRPEVGQVWERDGKRRYIAEFIEWCNPFFGKRIPVMSDSCDVIWCSGGRGGRRNACRASYFAKWLEGATLVEANDGSP